MGVCVCGCVLMCREETSSVLPCHMLCAAPRCDMAKERETQRKSKEKTTHTTIQHKELASEKGEERKTGSMSADTTRVPSVSSSSLSKKRERNEKGKRKQTRIPLK